MLKKTLHQTAFLGLLIILLINSGTVLDIGENLTQIIPVYDGYSISHATNSRKLGGRDITEHLRLLLAKQGKSMTTTAEFEIIKGIKESVCFVATENKGLGSNTTPTHYEVSLCHIRLKSGLNPVNYRSESTGGLSLTIECNDLLKRFVFVILFDVLSYLASRW